MLISLAELTAGPTIRRVKSSAAADAALTASIRAQGVVTPILVRPCAGITTLDDAPMPVRSNQPRWEVVIGSRRWRCAEAAGLTEIPAEVREMTDTDARLAQMAELGTGEPLHEVDQWRAVRRLMEEDGLSAGQAATAMGLAERQVRLMDRIARLPDSLLALCEIELPRRHQLRQILRASRLEQQALGQAKDAIYQEGGEDHVRWGMLAIRAKRPDHMLRADAIFDVEASGLPWDEDLFVQDGDREQWTTVECDAFLRLQREALVLQVAGKKRHQVVEPGEYDPKLPKGFKRSWGDRNKLKAHEWALACVLDNGRVAWTTAIDTKAQAEAEQKKAAKRQQSPDADDAQAGPDTSDEASDRTDDEAADDEDDDRDDVDVDVTTGRGVDTLIGLSKAGQALLHKARTETLRRVLRENDVEAHDLLALFVVALCSRNVTVAGLSRSEIEAWATKLLTPDGQLCDPSDDLVRNVARNVLADMLSIGEISGSYAMHSGWPAEVVGLIVRADLGLPRFDTAEFLGQCARPVLEDCAKAAGVAYKGTAKAMRERLVGQAEGWVPTAAQFGAAVPQ